MQINLSCIISTINLNFSTFKIQNTTMDNEPPLMTTVATSENAVMLKQSAVWNHFERIYINEELETKCLINDCAKILSTPHHSTSTLIRHLRSVHKLTEFKSKEKLVNRRNTKKISLELKTKLDHAALVAIVEDGRSFNDFSKNGFKKFFQLALLSNKIFVGIIHVLTLSISRLQYKFPHRNTINKQLKRSSYKTFIFNG